MNWCPARLPTPPSPPQQTRAPTQTTATGNLYPQLASPPRSSRRHKKMDRSTALFLLFSRGITSRGWQNKMASARKATDSLRCVPENICISFLPKLPDHEQISQTTGEILIRQGREYFSCVFLTTSKSMNQVETRLCKWQLDAIGQCIKMKRHTAFHLSWTLQERSLNPTAPAKQGK